MSDEPDRVVDWTCALELDSSRSVVAGSETALCEAIRRGADLRIYTEFRHNEHIDVESDNAELIRETADFRVTYLVDDRWVAGIISLRQPINLPDGFGPRPSMSFFMYNQNGQQAIARPYLDGGRATGDLGPSPPSGAFATMPKYHEQDNWDAGTNAPSSNFVYDFDLYRFWVHDGWRLALSHTDDGAVESGSLAALAEAFAQGCEVKVGISGLCTDLVKDPAQAIGHEVFVHTGSCYYYTGSRLFLAASHPVVRNRPDIPMHYVSEGWDFGWLMPRTDGFVAGLLYDPYTLRYRRTEGHYALRWFVR
jgi:hypothetical protein